MYCQNCGSEVAEGVKFCPGCGTKLGRDSQEKGTTQLRCKSCDGVMNVDGDSPVLYCTYCGSKELINESENVTIQRIKSKAYKDIELEKIKAEEEKEREV